MTLPELGVTSIWSSLLLQYEHESYEQVWKKKRKNIFEKRCESSFTFLVIIVLYRNKSYVKALKFKEEYPSKLRKAGNELKNKISFVSTFPI